MDKFNTDFDLWFAAVMLCVILLIYALDLLVKGDPK